MSDREAQKILARVERGECVETDKVLQAQHKLGEAVELDVVSMDDEEDDGDHDSIGINEDDEILVDSPKVDGFQIYQEP